jgi:hypothetical protein
VDLAVGLVISSMAAQPNKKKTIEMDTRMFRIDFLCNDNLINITLLL